MGFLDTIYYFFKKRSSIKFISYFKKILPNFVVYHLFKNSIRVGLHSISKDCFFYLSKKNLSENLSFKFLITKIVFFAILKNFGSKDQILFDRDYYDIVNFVNSFQKNY